jgi:hypothetical protein
MFNPFLALARLLQDTPLRLELSQSTWTVPIIGAIHVLAIAWFGGTVFGGAVLVPNARLRRFRWIGLAVLLCTGFLLFWSQPLRLYYSQFFRAKILLLVLLALAAFLPSRFARFGLLVSLVLWAGVILASRGIAYR